MKQADNRAAAYMNIWNSGQDHLLNDLATENIQVHYSHFQTPLQGIEAYRNVLRMTYNYFPDIKLTLKEIIPTSNGATVHWQYTGTHRNGELFGAKPAGKLITVSGISVLEFNAQRVAREFGIVDNLSLVIQLGLLKI